MSRTRTALFSIITACLLAAGGTTVALAAGGGSAPRWSAARTGPGASPSVFLNYGSGFTLQDGLVCAGGFVSCSRFAGCLAIGSYRGRGGFPRTHLWASVRG